jgi:hypothetical protein
LWRTLQRGAVGFSRQFNGLDFREVKFATARLVAARNGTNGLRAKSVRHAAVVD